MGMYTCVHVRFRISKLTKQKASKDHQLHPSDYKREIQKARKKGDEGLQRLAKARASRHGGQLHGP